MYGTVDGGYLTAEGRAYAPDREAASMIPNRPEKAVWLDIPEDCRISGEFTGDDDIHVVFGDLHDGAEMSFERVALERFVRLANELLALQIPDDPTADIPRLHAPSSSGSHR